MVPSGKRQEHRTCASGSTIVSTSQQTKNGTFLEEAPLSHPKDENDFLSVLRIVEIKYIIIFHQ